MEMTLNMSPRRTTYDPPDCEGANAEFDGYSLLSFAVGYAAANLAYLFICQLCSNVRRPFRTCVESRRNCMKDVLSGCRPLEIVRKVSMLLAILVIDRSSAKRGRPNPGNRDQPMHGFQRPFSGHAEVDDQVTVLPLDQTKSAPFYQPGTPSPMRCNAIERLDSTVR